VTARSSASDSPSHTPLGHQTFPAKRPTTLPDGLHSTHRPTKGNTHPPQPIFPTWHPNTQIPPSTETQFPHEHPRPTVSSSSFSRHPPAVAVAFEVIGGLLGLLVLFGVIRCLVSYGRTPDHDRVAAFIDRHRIQREMEELEGQQYQSFMRRSSMNGPAPPPYLPRPPSYHGHHDEASASTPLNSSYNLHSDGSPPSSPPSTPPPIQQHADRSTTSSPTQLPDR
jgi:hypothetical protein